MKKNIFLLGLSAILITACGTNSKPDAGATPPSESGITLSIACFENEQLTDAYVAHCYVHTVDGNSDPVSGLAYDIAVVSNVKVQGTRTGTILTTDPITFSDYSENFVQNDVKKTDSLIIFPTENTTDVTYLGNWQIGAVNSHSNLTLAESSFNLETTGELNYIIGNETVYGPYGSASAHIEYPRNTAYPTEEALEKGEEVESEEGFFFFDLVYDPGLRNQVVYLGAHTSGNRIGTAQTILLELEEEEEAAQ